jgi:hypothetical protein
MIEALERALAMRGAGQPFDFDTHQPLDGEARILCTKHYQCVSQFA